MKQYTVTGMSCAACSARVEKAVSKVPGVTSCSVSLLTNSMGVEGTAAPQEIIRAVENAGYGAAEKKRGGAETAGAAEAMPQEEMLKDHRKTRIFSRSFWCCFKKRRNGAKTGASGAAGPVAG